MHIALNTYSLRNEWNFLGPTPVEAAVRFAKDLGMENMEILDSHFDLSRADEIIKICTDNGIKVFSFAPHTKILAKKDEIPDQIASGKKWIDIAKKYGVDFIRVQVGDGPLQRIFPPLEDFDEEEMADYRQQVVEAIECTAPVVDPLLTYAEKEGVKIGIETHHSYSSNFEYMTQFNARWPSPYIGWIFDIGNYENDYMRWKGLDAIKKRTFYIHAKAYAFDENGFEKTLDYPRACKILHDAGFSGKWSIEFEGKMCGFVGVWRTRELIEHSIAKTTGAHYQMRLAVPDEDEFMEKYAQD
jgi:sugar phosphate isomerase/epimerase